MCPFLPIELIDYILNFNEEWKILGNRFIYIKKIAQIPRPKKIFDGGFGIRLIFYPKSFLLYYSGTYCHSVNVYTHRNEIIDYHYLCCTTNQWITLLLGKLCLSN